MKWSFATKTDAIIRRHQYFAAFKNAGWILLVFDEAKSHLDFTVIETAVNLGIPIFCCQETRHITCTSGKDSN